jgi:alkanesulfonate monooxygenase SsuD/methylene tetrahydromethanopterin reductase-like flavin-dependent oxidoreductase (luciferase family)
VSASRFYFAATFAGKNVPEAFQATLAERYAGYDFAWHGKAADTAGNPAATMFADRPDIEQYLLDRFAVVGTVEQCRERLVELSAEVDGVFCSVLFEDVLDQLDLVGAMVDGTVLAGAA